MLLYNLVIFLYGLVIRNAAVKKTKAKQWVEGRRNWRERLTEKINTLHSTERIWVHCASYGEFEQGRPVIEGIRSRYPNKKIILSFFSPSGYESFKGWSGAEVIVYLPLDRPSNARDFISIVKPQAVIFIKYEFWINFLFQLKKEKIPTYLVSATFKNHHPFFKSYGSIFRRSLQSFNILFVQDNNSATLLESVGIKNYEICGDTRFDRVIQIRNNFTDIEKVKQFKQDLQLFVAGSTWPKDEVFLISAYTKMDHSKVKLVLAPHNLGDELLSETVEKLKKHNLSYSLITEEIKPDSSVLIINTMGMLSKIYHYGFCAYIGGGFNEGIHNTLEPAVYGIPVAFCGEDHVKYNEAVEMLKRGAAVLISSEEQLISNVNLWLHDENERNKIRRVLDTYFKENENVTDKILAKMNLN